MVTPFRGHSNYSQQSVRERQKRSHLLRARKVVNVITQGRNRIVAVGLEELLDQEPGLIRVLQCT